jgi:hypothetical protein
MILLRSPQNMHNIQLLLTRYCDNHFVYEVQRCAQSDLACAQQL